MDVKVLNIILAMCLILIFNFKTVLLIQCWDCVSLYDKRCNDPFDNRTLYMTDCSKKTKYIVEERGHVQAKMCRKMYQKVEGEERIIRGCGYIGDIGYWDGRWCFERAGSYDIWYEYCHCNDKDGCNGAWTGTPHSKLLILSVFIGLTVVLWH